MKPLIYIVAVIWLASVVSAATFDIRDYGAVGDGTTMNTLAFQKAIAAAHAAGTATQPSNVLVAHGTYLTGQVVLRSNVILRMDETGTLLASHEPHDYPTNPGDWVVVFANTETNIGIIGSGTIDGAQNQYIGGWDAPNDEFIPKTWAGVSNCTGECRPRLVQFRNCSKIYVSDVMLQNSPDWTFHLQNSTDIVVERLRQYGDYRWPNNDGIDIDSSQNVRVTNSVFNTGDDGVCIKSTIGLNTVHDVYVYNCTIRSRSSAIKFGSNTDTDIYNMWFEKVTIWDSSRGLGIQQRSGGNIWNVTYLEMTIETKQPPIGWWGSGEPIWITSMPRTCDPNPSPVGTIREITFRNIAAKCENSVLISGRSPGNVVRGIVLDDVRIFVSRWGNVTRPDHDYRPTSCLTPDHQAAPVNGIYVERAEGVSLNDVSVEFDRSNPQPYWSKVCVDVSLAGYPVKQNDVTCKPV